MGLLPSEALGRLATSGHGLIIKGAVGGPKEGLLGAAAAALKAVSRI